LKVLHTEWSQGWGGQELRILADCRVLTDMGHEPAVLAQPGSLMAAEVEQRGFRVLTAPMPGPHNPKAVLHIAGLLKREAFDVVNTHSSVDSWLVGYAAKLTRIPVLVRTRHLSVPTAAHPLNLVYRWPDAVVTTGEIIRRRLVDVNRLPDHRVVSIPTGVDLERFDPDLDPGDIRKELRIRPKNRVATMVAVLRSWKRHEVFLEAAAVLAMSRPELKFLVVGGGEGLKRVADCIKDLGLSGRAVMTGRREDVERILAVSDVCLLTSESSEGVPQSILQYQAMSKPVVATAAGGIPEVVQDGVTGLLCPVNDSGAAARAMAKVLDDPDLARRLGENGRRQVVAGHSLQVMGQKTVELYQRLYWSKTGRHLDGGKRR
jgi:glycosyltransferase involved in cell wall biosynthesis